MKNVFIKFIKKCILNFCPDLGLLRLAVYP